MKPVFIGTKFEQITEYLKRLSNGVYSTRTQINITPVGVAANTVAEQTFTVARLSTDESVSVVSVAAQTAGVGVLTSRVSATNTLAVTFINPTAGALTPVSGQYRLMRTFP
jgi:uncharacterized Fe-S cluster-containing MiaB family protein